MRVRQGRWQWRLLYTCAAMALICAARGQEAPHETSSEPDRSTVSSDEAVSESRPVTRDQGDASVLGNDDVVEMTKAGFAETTIVAAIAANDTTFDVSAR